MKFHPILFSTEMVQAIISDVKKQTRRVLKPQPDPEGDGVDYMPNAASIEWEQFYGEVWKPWKWETEQGESISSFCPYGQPGDVLWVRETWANLNADYPTNPKCYVYKANDLIGNSYGPVTWKPSIHMPKEACRLFLQIKSIRVERLQEISEDDAMAEGVLEYENDGYFKNYFKQKGYRTQDGVECLTAKASFQSLWCSIHKIESWQSNPWVWVIQFDRIEKPQNFQPCNSTFLPPA